MCFQLQRPKHFEDTLFCARLEDWDAHAVLPMGKLLKIVGKKGEIEVETTAILSNYGIDDEEFKDEVSWILRSEPGSINEIASPIFLHRFDFSIQIFENMDVSPSWEIPAEEIKFRRDYRKELVFTIDPMTARDLDDAVSVKKIADDLYEVREYSNFGVSVFTLRLHSLV